LANVSVFTPAFSETTAVAIRVSLKDGQDPVIGWLTPRKINDREDAIAHANRNARDDRRAGMEPSVWELF